MTGVNVVAIATNGGASTWSKVVELRTKVATANAPMAAAFVTNSKVIGAWMTVEKATNTAQFILGDGMSIGGFPVLESNLVPDTLTKGSGTGLSAAIFGDWSEVLLGVWGDGVDLIVDPYVDARKRKISVTAWTSPGASVRHAASFSRCVDISTA